LHGLLLGSLHIVAQSYKALSIMLLELEIAHNRTDSTIFYINGAANNQNPLVLAFGHSNKNTSRSILLNNSLLSSVLSDCVSFWLSIGSVCWRLGYCCGRKVGQIWVKSLEFRLLRQKFIYFIKVNLLTPSIE